MNRKENLIKRREFVFEKYNQHPTSKERPHIKALFERPIVCINAEITWIENFIEQNFLTTYYIEKKKRSKEKKEEEKRRRFELKQQKNREKHKGH